MKDLIVLNDDLSIDIIREKKFKYKKNMDYVLIPMNSYDMDNTFIATRANKYMDFDYCDLNMRLSMVCYDHDNENSLFENIIEGGSIRVDNIIDMYNYIHSINKLDFMNSFMAGGLENMVIYNFDIMEFDIKIYKDGEIIFEYVYDKLEDGTYNGDSNGYYEAIFGTIYKKLKKIYRSLSDIMSSMDLIDIDLKKNTWRLLDSHKVKKLKKNNLYGVHLYHSDSFYFIEPEIYEVLYRNNTTYYVSVDIFDEADNEPVDVKDIERYENYDDLLDEMVWYDHITSYLNIFNTLEIIIYYKYIMISAMLIFSDLINNETFNLVLSISFRSGDYFRYFDKRVMPSIETLLYEKED